MTILTQQSHYKVSFLDVVGSVDLGAFHSHAQHPLQLRDTSIPINAGTSSCDIVDVAHE